MYRRSLLVGAVCAVSFLLPQAKATTLLIDVSGGTADFCGSCGANGTTFGYLFTISSNMTVTAIGLFDVGSDGLGADSAVGLFTSTGTLLGSATITDLSTVVASGEPSGRWLFENFGAPIVLGPGSYLLGAVFGDTLPTALTSVTGTGYSGASGVTILGGAKGDTGAGLMGPLTPLGNIIYGPNLIIDDTIGSEVQTPEPGSALLLLVGIAGVVALRFRGPRPA